MPGDLKILQEENDVRNGWMDGWLNPQINV